MTCDPLFKLLRKGEKFEWNDDCQVAFNKIKTYLQTPHFISPPDPKKPLLLYLAISENLMGSILAQEGKEWHTKKAIYYLNKRMTGYELNYSPLEKTCWALVWCTRRLRHYMLAFPVILISRMDPLKYLFENLAFTSTIS